MPFTIPSADEALAPLVQSQVFETDLAILVAGFSGTGVVTGCGVTAQGSPDMTVAVAAGTILAAGVAVAVTGGNLTVGAADATNPRVDLISASAAGVKTITAGVAAAVASVKPADLPAGHIGLAFVYIAPADTAINTNEITDKRAIIATGSAWTDYTPTVGSSGTPPTLGSSTIIGRYKLLDAKTMALNIEFNITTGGAWNPGTGVYTFTLPSGITTAARRQALTAHLNDASTTRYVGSALTGLSATTIALVSVYTDTTGAAGFGATTPLTLATGDYLVITGLLEIA